MAGELPTQTGRSHPAEKGTLISRMRCSEIDLAICVLVEYL